MALRHLVLGLLTDRPDHAYALKARLAPGVPREQRVNDGVLYPLLAKLEAEGRVTGRDEPGRGGRSRRVYAATESGTQEFLHWLRSDADESVAPLHELYTDHPLVKLLFAHHLGPAELGAKLAGHARHLHERIAALEAISDMPDARHGFGPALLDLEVRQLRERLSWLRDLAHTVAERE